MTHWRHHDPNDLPALTTLVNHCALGGEASVAPRTLEGLQSEIEAPRVDPAEDLRVWTDGDCAVPRAFSRLHVDPVDDELHGRLYYAIARIEDAGFEREIWRWAAARMLTLGGPAGAVRLVHAVDGQDPARSERLAGAGFRSFRTYLVLARPLEVPPLRSPLPPGFTIRGCQPRADVHAYVAVYNVAFADAYRFTPLDPVDFLHGTRSPSYDPERDLVLVDSQGAIAGFCFSEIDAEQPTLGHVASLGILPHQRRRGLAEALLTEALARLHAGGARRAHLFVDADSPTGATRLYARTGFTRLHAQQRLELDVAGMRRLLAT